MASRPRASALVLLWLLGNGLRIPILAVPSVIPALRSELHLSGTEIGILTGLPVVLFAAAALLGSRLVARFGALGAAVFGLFLAALGSALRAAAGGVLTLFAATAVVGAGIAFAQPAMSALVGRWTPRHIALGTGVYTNGLLIGEVIPVSLFPLLFPLLGHSWRALFVVWAIPNAVIALLVWATAPAESGTPIVIPPRWWPDWPARDIWRLGLIFGSSGALYFATNAFLPGYLIESGRPDLISAALIALNLGQVPASLLLISFARRLERKAWPFYLAAALASLAVAGMATTASAVTVACAGLLGFSAGGVLALGLTLPPLLSTPQEVARVSGAMFMIGYMCAMIVSVASGAAWDLTRSTRVSFLPIAVAILPLLLLVPTLRFNRREGAGARTQQSIGKDAPDAP